MERTNGKGKDFEPGLPMAALLVPAVCFGAGGILGWASVLFFAAEELIPTAEYLTELFHLIRAGEVSVSFFPLLVRRVSECAVLFLLSCSTLGTVGAWLSLFVHGFLFSFSVSCVIRIFGASAWGVAGGLFLLPALMRVPSLLFCFSGGVCARRNRGQVGICVPALKYVVYGIGLCLLCVCLECLLLPEVLQILLDLMP